MGLENDTIVTVVKLEGDYIHVKSNEKEYRVESKFLKPVKKFINVRRDTSQLDDLEIFKRASVLVDLKGKYDSSFRNEILAIKHEDDPRKRWVHNNNGAQIGHPCEFKTRAFVEPFKFYTMYVEGLKEAHGEGVKVNHRTQVIRTIKDSAILNKECVELKRYRTLELLKNQVLRLMKSHSDEF